MFSLLLLFCRKPRERCYEYVHKQSIRCGIAVSQSFFAEQKPVFVHSVGSHIACWSHCSFAMQCGTSNLTTKKLTGTIVLCLPMLAVCQTKKLSSKILYILSYILSHVQGPVTE
jgi:hypothetical protein